MINIDEQVAEVENRFVWTLHAEKENELKKLELKMKSELVPAMETARVEYWNSQTLRKRVYNIREQDKPRIGAVGRNRYVRLDMLKIPHPAVFNLLVDQNFIDRTVFVGVKDNGEMDGTK